MSPLAAGRVLGGDNPPAKTKKEDAAPQDAAESSPLQTTIRNMRLVEGRLEKEDAGPETRAIQTQIVKDLDKLIEQAKQQQNQNQGGQGGAPQRPDQPQPQESRSERRTRRQQQPQNSKKQQSQKERAGGQSERRKDQERASESTDKVSERKARSPEAVRRERLETDVWGHLPPGLRQELLNAYSEKYLLRYDELIKRYYEALADQKQR